MGKKYTTDIISIGDHSLDAPVMVQIDALIADGLHSEAGYLTEESGTTRLTDAEIAAMGYIKTYTDTDTNTQLSDAQIAEMGYIKTYTDTNTNTQLTSAQIAAMGYLSTATGLEVFRSEKNIDDQGTYMFAQDDGGWTGGARLAGAHNGYGVISMHLHTGGYYGQIHLSSQTGDMGIRFQENSDTWGTIYTVHTSKHFSTADVADGKTAHGWGNHADAEYLTSYTDTDTQLTDAEIAAMGYIKTYTDTDTNTQLTSAQISAMGYASSGFDSVADLSAPNTTVGTWNTATTADWGTPRIGSSVGRYIDNAGSLSFAVPAGMKTAYISQLTWSSGGYADVYGIQADGDAIFLRRINTKQNVENHNHGNPNQHDGSTIAFAGHIGDYPTIRISNKSGRLHLTGLGFSKSEVSASDGTGMVNPSQFSTAVTYSSLSGKPTIPSGNSIIDWTTDQGATNIHSGNYTNTDTNTQLSSAQIAAMGYVSTSQIDTVSGEFPFMSKKLSGTGIGSSYDERVVLIVPRVTTNTSSHNKCVGKITASKTGGNVFDTLDIAVNSVWNSTEANFLQMGQRSGHKWVTCLYGGVEWIAIKFHLTNNPYTQLYFHGQHKANSLDVNNDSLKVISYLDTLSGVLNAEINNSITDWTGSSNSLTFNGNNIHHAGNLTNVSQLANDSGYITSYTDTDTNTQLTSAEIAAMGYLTEMPSHSHDYLYHSSSAQLADIDLDSISTSGVYQSASTYASNSNIPYANYFTMLHLDNAVGRAAQLWFGDSPGRMYYRPKQGANTWHPWEHVITSGGISQTKAGLLQSNASLRAPIFYDSNDTNYYLNPSATSNLSNVEVQSISVQNRSALSVAHWSASSNTTGAIKIKIPGTHNSKWSMMVIRVTVYEYNSGAHSIFTVSGHDWTSGWYNNSITKMGSQAATMSLGFSTSANEDYLILGDVSTLWQYGHVTVDVISHPSFYSSSMDITEGWAISQVTSLSGITITNVTNKQIYDSSNLTNVSQLANDSSYLTTSGKAADSQLIDGIDSSRIVYGHNDRKSTRADSVGIVSTTQNSGFHYGSSPTGGATTDWENWITCAGGAWTSGNNYDFKISHPFHSDKLHVSRMANGVSYDWRQIFTTGMSVNIGASYSFTGAAFYDASDTQYLVDPGGASALSRIRLINNTTPFMIKVNSGYKTWVHHIASDDTYIFAPSTANGGETWDWSNQMGISTSGVVTANNFVLRSDERSKTEIKNLTRDNIDVSWKSFEMKGNEGDYRTGVIAQELEETHPEFVNTDAKGFKSVKYIDLLIAKIAELEARLEILEK